MYGCIWWDKKTIPEESFASWWCNFRFTKGKCLVKFICFSMCMQSYSSLQVENHQPNDVMEYGGSPKTEFQRYIRLGRKGKRPSELYWLSLSMNFRRTTFFLGALVLLQQAHSYHSSRHVGLVLWWWGWSRWRQALGSPANNIVEWDPEIERVKLSSGKPLVCVISCCCFHNSATFMLHIQTHNWWGAATTVRFIVKTW